VYHIFIDFNKAYGSIRREVLYNILIECGVPMKLLRVLNMCLNETCSRVRVGKHLSDLFPIRNDLKQRDALSPLLFQLCFRLRRFEGSGKPDGLKLNGKHQLLVYADNVNILGGNVHTIKKTIDALVVASKENGLEVNADITKYMVMS